MFGTPQHSDTVTDSQSNINIFRALPWNIGYMSRCASLAMRVCLSISGESMAKVTPVPNLIVWKKRSGSAMGTGRHLLARYHCCSLSSRWEVANMTEIMASSAKTRNAITE
jgi:hypothetical protein